MILRLLGIVSLCNLEYIYNDQKVNLQENLLPFFRIEGAPWKRSHNKPLTTVYNIRVDTLLGPMNIFSSPFYRKIWGGEFILLWSIFIH